MIFKKKKKKIQTKIKGTRVEIKIEINNIRPIIPRNANGNEP